MPSMQNVIIYSAGGNLTLGCTLNPSTSSLSYTSLKIAADSRTIYKTEINKYFIKTQYMYPYRLYSIIVVLYSIQRQIIYLSGKVKEN